MVYTIKMPKAAMGMNEGIVLDWLVDVGNSVAEGDPLLEIEAEKSTFEIAANEGGTLREKYVGEGESVAPRTILGVVADPDEDISDVRTEARGEPIEATAKSADPEPSPDPTGSDVDQGEESEKVRSSPKARRRADETGVALADVEGSGPGGAVTAADVDAAHAEPEEPEPAANPAAAESSTVRATPKARRRARELDVDLGDVEGTGPKGAVTVANLPADGQAVQHSRGTASIDTAGPEPGEIEAQPLSGMRQTIADRLGRSSREAVHVTVHRDVPITEVIDAANVVDEYVEADANVTDVLLLAVSATLADHPAFNATFDGDTVTRYGSQHIGIAVDLDAGLVTPVLRDVESRSLTDVVAGRRQVTQAVLDGEYTSEDLEGGTFTVSNLGGLGVDSFTPIINPPQVAILGVDRIVERVVQDDDGTITAVPHIGLDVTFDHRVVDGADAARFLDTLASHLHNPWLPLLERA